MTTPTHDIDETSPRIAHRAELIELFERGEKPKSDWRVGTEHEKFGLHVAQYVSLHYLDFCP